MIYRPTFRPQLGDPTTTYDGSICTYSSGAMALDRHTLGDVQVWGGELLKASGDTTPLDGGTLYDLGKAWAAYGQHLDDRTGGLWADLTKALDEGRGAVVQIERSYIPTTYRCGRPFAGTHALYINHRLPNAAMFVADPLCTAYQDVPERYIRQAVEAFGRRPKLFPDDPAASQRIAFAVTRIAIAPPDSSTEEPMLTFAISAWTPGTLTVKGGPQHGIIRLRDGHVEPIAAGEVKTGIPTKLGAPFDAEPGDRQNGYQVVYKGEAWFLLATDVDFVAAPADRQHTVTLASDGQVIFTGDI